ncbi:MAG: DUF6603 domain-containing protein [Adhaeribacter sp.]
MDISQEHIENLKASLTGYGLAEVANAIDTATVTDNPNGYTLAIKAKFLETDVALNCGIIKADGSADSFMFWLATAAPTKEPLATKAFGEYFPQMMPDSPWGLAPDLPFPSLASARVDELQWLYLYYTDTAKEKEFFEHIPSPVLDLQTVKDITNPTFTDITIANQATAGLYYKGKYAAPWMQLLPENSPWAIMLGSSEPNNDLRVAVNGGIVEEQVFSSIKLVVPFFVKDDPFGTDLVKRISLSFGIASSFNHGLQLVGTASRSLSLTGKIQFSDRVDLTVTGTWPLDDDEILIAANTSLQNINQYFNSSSIPGISLPENIKADLILHISKSKFELDKISFYLSLTDWNIDPGVFTIPLVNFQVQIYAPTSVALMLANFSAKAKIGEVEMNCSGSYPGGELSLSLDPATPIYLNKLAEAFGVSDAGFSPNLAVTELSGQYNTSTKFVSLALRIADTSKGVKIGNLGFALNNFYLKVYGSGSYTFKVEADFSYNFTKIVTHSPLVFSGSAAYDNGWIFNANYTGAVTIADLAFEFGFGSVPAELNAVSFESLKLIIDTKNNVKYFNGACTVTIYDKPVKMDLLVNQTATLTRFSGKFVTVFNSRSASFFANFIKQETGFQLELDLLFTVAGVTIMLKAEVEKSSANSGTEKPVVQKRFSGGTQNLNIHVSDLLSELLEGKINYKSVIPEALLPDVVLEDIFVSFDGTTKQMDLIALTQLGGKEIRLLFQRQPGADENADAIYSFGINADFASLGGLPLVGDELKDVKLTNVGFIYTTAAGDFKLPELSSKGDVKLISIPVKGKAYGTGFNLLGKLELPNDPDGISLTLPVSSSGSMQNIPAINEKTVLIPKVRLPTAPLDPATTWLNIDKKLGPVNINQVGFSFIDNYLALLISGSLEMAGLKITVQGLGLSFQLSKLMAGEKFDADFKLSGLGLSYIKPPLKISAIFLRVDPKPDEIISFYGAAQIATSGFLISGVGGYAKLKSGNPSFFVYAVYKGPIGGPGFFFVTGIAAGFGYNRRLRAPNLEEVPKYPLVELILSGEDKSANDVMQDLVTGNWLPSSEGDYWLAIGIEFTSFKIIDSFVLLTAQFGTKVEFSVIGLSLLKWPQTGTAIAYIELAILARFGPDSDVIAVTAMLTPNCYVLDKNCKLTGGFAFYAWVSGEHEGDFVVTLGGYHPAYKVPKHYPTVDRLGLTWKFSNVLAIHGEMYFALTPDAIMAGGRWEIKYDLSFLSASVTVWADMIMYWAPFYYQLDAGIIIRIEANIKVLFIHIHFKIQMSCEIHIWGPPFAGEIYVDWTIFSFTIPFGSTVKKLPPPLKWSNTNAAQLGFKESFVPKKGNRFNALDTRFINGVMNEYEDPIKKTITTFINPYDLVVGVDSFFPVTDVFTDTTITIDDNVFTSLKSPDEKFKVAESTIMQVAGADYPVSVSDRNLNFGIKPMSITEANVRLNVWLEIENDGIPAPVKTNLGFITIAKGVTSALWEGKAEKDKSNTSDNGAILKNVLSGIQLHAVEELDNTVLSINTANGYYQNKDLQIPAISYLLNRDAEANLTEKVMPEIRDELLKTDPFLALTSLNNLGFDLTEPEKLSYDDLGINAPLFKAALAQKLPNILT